MNTQYMERCQINGKNFKICKAAFTMLNNYQENKMVVNCQDIGFTIIVQP